MPEPTWLTDPFGQMHRTAHTEGGICVCLCSECQNCNREAAK